ncbi:hypothetical protein VTG60DRAFT_1291 [Thermothelomyces hinnuleus]
MDAYLNVQVFTGSMYTASFISLWLLRSWKLQQLALLGLDNDQKGETKQVTSTAGGGLDSPQTSGVQAYLRGMVVVKRV